MRLAVCLALGSLAFAQKQPITHEALWTLKRVGAPALSPDGKHAVFSVANPAYDEKDQSSDLWIVATDGATPARQLTASKAPESGVSWAPDSRRIAFTTRREGDEAAQVYVLDLAGGEAQRVTSIRGGASAPKFSPDGKSILFISTVKPDKPAGKYQARVYESFPIRYWDRWLDEGQPHPFIQSLEAGAKPKDVLTGTELSKVPGFGGAMGDTGPTMTAIWTPDSKSIVFVATPNRNQAAYANVVSHLFVASIDGGEPRAIAGTPHDSYSRPVFHPDGKALYALHQKEGEKAYSINRPVMFTWPNPGDPKFVATGFDRSVDSLDFSADAKTVYLSADDAAHGKLYRMSADGGAVTPLFDVERGSYGGFASENNVMVASFDSATAPAEIVRIDAKGHRALTHFNDAALAKLDLAPVREFWFTSAKGRRIHNLIALPPGFDESKKYPLFVLMHGGPHGAWKDQFVLRWNYHMLAQPGYVVLMTNYTGSTGFGEAFAQAIQGDPLKTPGDEINQAADEAIKQFKFIDSTRQAAGGASYGGHLSNWMQATTTRYKCLITHAGLINLESQWGTSDGIYHREVNNGGPVWEQGAVWREQNPIRYAAKFRTPMLLTVGENDFRVPLNQTLENWSVHQRLKIPSKLIVFPRANHWILNGEDSRFFYAEVAAWLKRWL